jgi:hypothetical protein
VSSATFLRVSTFSYSNLPNSPNELSKSLLTSISLYTFQESITSFALRLIIAALATSELKILKRLKAIETVLGLNDCTYIA